MKRNNSYIKTTCLFVLMFLSITSVNAECTSKEKNRLYKLASNIKLNYSYEEIYSEEGEEYYVTFSVLATGLSDELYIEELDSANQIKFYKEDEIDGVITATDFSSGLKKFEVYAVSGQCKEAIKTLNLTIPRFNYYYYDKLCEGITNDFSLCDKWYQGNISYPTFEIKVKAYRDGLKPIEKQNEGINTKTSWYKVVSDFILEYYIYSVIVGLILIGLAIFGIYKYREKRSGF